MKPIFRIAVAVSLFATSALPAHAGLFGLSEKDEIEAGQKVAADAEKEYGGALHPNDPMSRRVRAIGEQFARLSTRKNIPYSYKVLGNDKVLNAFAAPGGPIYVTRKLMNTVANDAELAYVLGHETAHIERKHIVKAVEKQQTAGILVGVLGALLGKGKTKDVVGTVGNVAFTVWSRGYGRDQETESDIVGVRWMSQLGYEPSAAISMMGRLGGGSSGLEKYLASHPNPKDRQATVEKIIADENLNDVARRSGGPKQWMNGATSEWPSTAPPAVEPPVPTVVAPQPAPANGQIVLGLPLRVEKTRHAQVVLGPVLELARWAGASARLVNRSTVVKFENNTLILRPNSRFVTINRANQEMTVAASEHNGSLYAPLGTIVQGMGGTATYDEATKSVWVTVGNQRGYLVLP